MNIDDTVHSFLVIEEPNERFGFDLGTADQILVYQQVIGLVEDTSCSRSRS